MLPEFWTQPGPPPAILFIYVFVHLFVCSNFIKPMTAFIHGKFPNVEGKAAVASL